jgi:bacterioferritin-associated ferredoxin
MRAWRKYWLTEVSAILRTALSCPMVVGSAFIWHVTPMGQGTKRGRRWSTLQGMDVGARPFNRESTRSAPDDRSQGSPVYRLWPARWCAPTDHRRVDKNANHSYYRPHASVMASEIGMYVCVCNSVTDRQIRHAARRGCESVEDLRRELKVATCCGKCEASAQRLLRECLVDATWSPELATATT